MVESSSRTKADDTTLSSNLPSLWLYLAGLCVTLSGLFAVNFELNDPGFARETYSLAIFGYVFSYILRLRQISLKSFSAPFIAFICLALTAVFTNDQFLEWLAPVAVHDDRFLSVQLIIAWTAILHTFMLTSDSTVLFACVPCMTLMALVSSRNADPAIQSAFIVFITSATFLMVHENFIRTRETQRTGYSASGARRNFGGQLLLTLLCLVGALAMANLVAMPIESVGQKLFDATGINTQDNRFVRSLRNARQQVQVSEENSINIATGPVADSDQEVMRIQCDRPLYWRGKTFTKYTGNSFTNEQQEDSLLDPQPNAMDTRSDQIGYVYYKYELPQSQYELPAADMLDSAEVMQDVEVVGGVMDEIYGAGYMVDVFAQVTELHLNNASSLMPLRPLDLGMKYRVVSRVASSDPSVLEQASSSPADIPPAIRADCLSTGVNGQILPKLKALVDSLTRGLHTNYDKAMAIKSYISSTCKYNLNAAAAPRDQDAVEYFLFTSQQGYCDCFAAAMTELCRYAGIPSRLVSGFLSGDATGNGYFSVKLKHKHLWCEVFFPHVGWVPFDATEDAQDITVHSHPKSAVKSSFMTWFFSNGPLPPLIGFTILVLIGLIVRNEILTRLGFRRKVNGHGPLFARENILIFQAYHEAVRLLARRGLLRPAWMTPDEFARYVIGNTEAIAPGIGDNFRAITQSYNVHLYGDRVAQHEEVQQVIAQLAGLRQALSRAKPRVLSAPHAYSQ